ncbi:hypothetical protein [Rhizobium leguminosarum]|uniref:hypothetical protein n=1 Tax=Rhizobium leguminosarum TaxID=384 RepID=UPI001FEDCFCB|nr:hypothetical protein [Rhizobium leguminosarum]
MRKILEAFRVEGRNGTMVAVEGSTDLPTAVGLLRDYMFLAKKYVKSQLTRTGVVPAH